MTNNMINKRDKRFFQFTEQNLQSQQKFSSLDIDVKIDCVNKTQRILFHLSLLFLCMVVSAAFVFKQIETKKPTKTVISDLNVLKKIEQPSKTLVSRIPAFYVSAHHQFLQNVSLRMADLIAAGIDEEMPNSTLVVMDKVIVIPKVILSTTTLLKEIV